MEKVKLEMMPANLAPQFEIPVCDKDYYNLRGEKVSVPPNDPKNPIHFWKIFPISVAEYDKYFSVKLPIERQNQAMKAANYQSLQIIHDPTLNPKSKVKPVKSAELILREGKMKMTKGDVLKLMEEKKQNEE